MKIVFFGTSDFAVPALEALAIKGYEITAVVTTPDQPTGRKKVITPPPVKSAAEKLGLQVFQPASLKDDSFFEIFKSLDFELAVVTAYGKIIPERYLSLLKHGFINIHPSLLPAYRGPTPIQSALLNGDKETGVTIMLIDKDMDHGPILAQEKYEIWPKTTYAQLSEELAKLGAEVLVKRIPDFIDGKIKPQGQKHELATLCKIYTREDGRLDWSRSTQENFNRVRALNPEPGTWTTWRGKVLNIKKAAVADDGRFEPLIVQLEGSKEMSFDSFLNGHPDFKLKDCN